MSTLEKLELFYDERKTNTIYNNIYDDYYGFMRLYVKIHDLLSQLKKNKRRSKSVLESYKKCTK